MVGLHCWNYSTPGPGPDRRTLADTPDLAEQAGVWSLTVMDHYFQMDQAGRVDEPMAEI
jgi:hypothetical protein